MRNDFNSEEAIRVIDKLISELSAKQLQIYISNITFNEEWWNNPSHKTMVEAHEYCDSFQRNIRWSLIDPIKENLDGIDSIDDEQYEDPYEWWARHTYELAEELYRELDFIIMGSQNNASQIETWEQCNKDSSIFQFDREYLPYAWIADTSEKIENIKNYIHKNR